MFSQLKKEQAAHHTDESLSLSSQIYRKKRVRDMTFFLHPKVQIALSMVFDNHVFNGLINFRVSWEMIGKEIR